MGNIVFMCASSSIYIVKGQAWDEQTHILLERVGEKSDILSIDLRSYLR